MLRISHYEEISGRLRIKSMRLQPEWQYVVKCQCNPSCRRRRIMPKAYTGWESRQSLGLTGTSELL
ncbi:hypothetical protein DPMN_014753 [Dreissena polymorpha]|uniref:Uncharacterized protein n=1 Tax=Dreissena polymorpha TaxID=45954 RepID=A0A9D4S4Z1_DREPO|nr:hypothetical protein DPMN_014753 [Dreissena polymorpha]